MPWFKVSDDFHAHPKVMSTDPAALGLWVVAGSWAGANLTGGFVPATVLPRLAPDAESLARKLVTAGLWRRCRGGYQFHEWDQRNPDASTAKALSSKRSAVGEFGNHKRWHEKRNLRVAGCEWCEGAPPPD